MAIKRYKATKDNTITDAYKEGNRYRAKCANMGLADSVEVFYLYGRAGIGVQERTRFLIEFDIDQLVQDIADGKTVDDANTKYFVKIFNVETPFTVPRLVNLSIHALTRAWDEGNGVDLDEYKDEGAPGDGTHTGDTLCTGTGSSWQVASAGVSWTTEGGDFGPSLGLQFLDDGTEDIEVDITTQVKAWIADPSTNYGLLVKLETEDTLVDSVSAQEVNLQIGNFPIFGATGTSPATFANTYENYEGTKIIIEGPTTTINYVFLDDTSDNTLTGNFNNGLEGPPAGELVAVVDKGTLFNISQVFATNIPGLANLVAAINNKSPYLYSALDNILSGAGGVIAGVAPVDPNNPETIIVDWNDVAGTDPNLGLPLELYSHGAGHTTGAQFYRTNNVGWRYLYDGVPEFDPTDSNYFDSATAIGPLAEPVRGRILYGYHAELLALGGAHPDVEAYLDPTELDISGNLATDLDPLGAGDCNGTATVRIVSKTTDPIRVTIVHSSPGGYNRVGNNFSLVPTGQYKMYGKINDTPFASNDTTIQGTLFSYAGTTGPVDSIEGSEEIEAEITNTTSYYDKKFSGRGSEYFFKRPYIEARWPDYEIDDRDNFYAKSPLTLDNTNNIFLKNYIDGTLADIPNEPPTIEFYSTEIFPTLTINDADQPASSTIIFDLSITGGPTVTLTEGVDWVDGTTAAETATAIVRAIKLNEELAAYIIADNRRGRDAVITFREGPNKFLTFKQDIIRGPANFITYNDQPFEVPIGLEITGTANVTFSSGEITPDATTITNPEEGVYKAAIDGLDTTEDLVYAVWRDNSANSTARVDIVTTSGYPTENIFLPPPDFDLSGSYIEIATNKPTGQTRRYYFGLDDANISTPTAGNVYVKDGGSLGNAMTNFQSALIDASGVGLGGGNAEYQYAPGEGANETVVGIWDGVDTMSLLGIEGVLFDGTIYTLSSTPWIGTVTNGNSDPLVFDPGEVTTASPLYLSTGQGSILYKEFIEVKHRIPAEVSDTTYVTSITNLKSVYSTEEQARFRLFIRSKDWSPTIYTVATKRLRTEVVEKAYFRITRIVDDLPVIDWGIEDTEHTRISYDELGAFFDLDLALFEPGWAYRIELAYEVKGELKVQPESFKFRVE